MKNIQRVSNDIFRKLIPLLRKKTFIEGVYTFFRDSKNDNFTIKVSIDRPEGWDDKEGE